jgi:hypothetical protein
MPFVMAEQKLRERNNRDVPGFMAPEIMPGITHLYRGRQEPDDRSFSPPRQRHPQAIERPCRYSLPEKRGLKQNSVSCHESNNTTPHSLKWV